MSSSEPNGLTTLIRHSDGSWRSIGTGVSLKVLRSDKETGASTILLRFDVGATFPAHNHPGGEEVYVIEGDIKLGKDLLNAGDYLYTAPDGKHAASSQNGCLMLVTVLKPIEIIKK